jgi:hypothetical protein
MVTTTFGYFLVHPIAWLIMNVCISKWKIYQIKPWHLGEKTQYMQLSYEHCFCRSLII